MKENVINQNNSCVFVKIFDEIHSFPLDFVPYTLVDLFLGLFNVSEVDGEGFWVAQPPDILQKICTCFRILATSSRLLVASWDWLSRRSMLEAFVDIGLRCLLQVKTQALRDLGASVTFGPQGEHQKGYHEAILRLTGEK